jgi:DNA-binding NarL/FixJ family response regulator
MSVKVVIADDQSLVRTGFRMILEAEPDIAVVGEASNGEQAVSAVTRLAPDVVLMDVRMPEVDGIEATRRIRAAGSHTRVLVLTTFDMDEYVYEALRAGASGFMLKDTPAEQLVDGVRVVAEGNGLLAPSVTSRLIAEVAKRPAPRTGPPPELTDLTPREREVFELVAKGLTNAEIAERLVVSDATVKTHVARTLSKLALRDRVQAVVFAYENGLVQPGAG